MLLCIVHSSRLRRVLIDARGGVRACVVRKCARIARPARPSAPLAWQGTWRLPWSWRTWPLWPPPSTPPLPRRPATLGPSTSPSCARRLRVRAHACVCAARAGRSEGGCTVVWHIGSWCRRRLPRPPRLKLPPLSSDHPEIPDVTVEYDFSYNITVPARQVRHCSHEDSHAHSQPPASSAPPRLSAPRSAAHAPSCRPTSTCRPCAASLWTC